MSNPKIGRAAVERNPLLKASNALAAQARQLRRAYQSEQEAHEAAIASMRSITNERIAEHQKEKQETADEARAAFAPLIAEAKQKIRENDALDREARPLIESLDSLDRRTVIERFGPHHGITFLSQITDEVSATDRTKVSLENTRDRLAWLFRLVDEAKEVLVGNMRELSKAIETAESVLDLDSPHGSQTMFTLKRLTRGANDRAVTLNSKLGGIKRTLRLIGESILAQGTPEVDPDANPFVETSGVLLDETDVNALKKALETDIAGTGGYGEEEAR